MNTRTSISTSFVLGLLFIAGGLLPTTTHAAVIAKTVVPCRSENTRCWPAAFDFMPDNKIVYTLVTKKAFIDQKK